MFYAKPITITPAELEELEAAVIRGYTDRVSLAGAGYLKQPAYPLVQRLKRRAHDAAVAATIGACL